MISANNGQWIKNKFYLYLVFIVLIVLSYTWSYAYLRYEKYTPAKFNLLIGKEIAGRFSAQIDSSIPVTLSYGYDSQFFWTLSVDPSLTNPYLLSIPERHAYRMQRILLPLLTRMIIQKNENLMYGLWFWELVGYLMIIIGITRICRRWTIRPYVPVILVLANPGLFISAIHPMSDTLAVGFIILALSFFIKNQYWASAIFFSLSLLTRETSLIIILLLGLFTVLYQTDQLKKIILPFSLACLPWILWQISIYRHFGHLPLGGPDQFNIIPMKGTFDTLSGNSGDSYSHKISVLIPFICLTSVLLLFSQRKQIIPFLIIGLSMITLFYGKPILEDIKGSMRTSSLLFVLNSIWIFIYPSLQYLPEKVQT